MGARTRPGVLTSLRAQGMGGSEDSERRGEQPRGGDDGGTPHAAKGWRTAALLLVVILACVTSVAGYRHLRAGASGASGRWSAGGALGRSPQPQSPAGPKRQDPYEIQDPTATGARFNIVSERRAGGDGLSERQAREMARLEALGYASGSTEGRGRSGVTIHDRALSQAGPNLYIDGHAPSAYLMDMQGKVLHRWHHSFEQAFPGRKLPKNTVDTGFYRRVHLFDDGALLAIFEGQGMIKLDRDSKLLWAYPARTHHDVQVMDDGTIYVLTRRSEMARRISPERPILHDAIDVLRPDGKRIRRVSILGAIERSRFANVLPRVHHGGDIFHTNTLKILDGRHAHRLPAFAKGNALISILMLNMIAVVDMKRGEVVWAMSDGWHHQHEPVLLDSGNMLLFDNGRERFSRVVEFDPVTQQTLWQYGGRGIDFYSRTCGTAQRLSNGNTLITETDQGRAFEVTRDSKIVWEFHTPQRAGDDANLIASLFQVQRLPADFPIGWARAPGDEAP